MDNIAKSVSELLNEWKTFIYPNGVYPNGIWPISVGELDSEGNVTPIKPIPNDPIIEVTISFDKSIFKP